MLSPNFISAAMIASGTRRIVGLGMAVAGEDRADHGGVALAARVGAQFLDALAPPRDLGGALALVGEGGQHQPVDALRLDLREGGGADPPDDVP